MSEDGRYLILLLTTTTNNITSVRARLVTSSMSVEQARARGGEDKSFRRGSFFFERVWV